MEIATDFCFFSPAPVAGLVDQAVRRVAEHEVEFATRWEGPVDLEGASSQKKRPILDAEGPSSAQTADGLDVPLAIGGEVVGVLAAELDRGAELPSRLEDALLITATQASAALQSSRLRREALHLRDYLEKLLEHASPDGIVMHCLPAHRDEEITDAVMEGPRSVVWDQSENKMHMNKAILDILIEKK